MNTHTATLSPREQLVVERVEAGLTNEAIAAELGLSSQMVARSLTSARRKLGVTKRREAVSEVADAPALSPAEIEVLEQIANGLDTEAAARALGRDAASVRRDLVQACLKVGAGESLLGASFATVRPAEAPRAETPQVAIAPAPLAVTARAAGSSYLAAIRRFWWLVAAGALMACATGVVSLYHVHPGIPPVLVSRSRITHTATAQLIVDTNPSSYYATALPSVVPGKTKVEQQRTPGTRSTKTATTRTAPTTTTKLIKLPSETTFTPTQNKQKTLVYLANVYPNLIQSLQVTRLRTKLFGDMKGKVVATALYSKAGDGRYRASPLPYIQIQATAGTGLKSIKLARATASTFIRYVADRQSRTTARHDIVVREIVRPQKSKASGGTSYPLGVFVGLATLGAFLLVAIVLDRLFPRARPATSVS
jgi:DNA-binding CsgD family transcriptional regulator